MEKYEVLEMEVIEFESEDVILTSDDVTEWTGSMAKCEGTGE